MNRSVVRPGTVKPPRSDPPASNTWIRSRAAGRSATANVPLGESAKAVGP